jgi:anaerobic selenocysteine-containing dehydrogenase
MMTARRIRLESEPAEWLGCGQATAFPLHLVSSQPRLRLHNQMDAAPVSARGKIAKRETLAINPLDARSRSIGDGEVVRVFHARGACFAAYPRPGPCAPALFGSPAAPGTASRGTRTSRPAPTAAPMFSRATTARRG